MQDVSVPGERIASAKVLRQKHAYGVKRPAWSNRVREECGERMLQAPGGAGT